MSKNILETLTGAVVLLVAVAFLVVAYKGSDMGLKASDGYSVNAKFADATGIQAGSDVRIGGIKIGAVSDMLLDSQTFEAIARLSIASDKKIPADSSAAIVSSGLLGEKFIQVTPGGDDSMLKDGDTIEFTQSAVSLEELIGKFVFSGGGVDGEDDSESSTGANE